jgi:hypothetical protein
MVLGSITPFLTPDGAFVFTLTSNGYKYLTFNLVTLLRDAKVPWKLCVVCADLASYRFFRGENVPCLRVAEPLPDFGMEVSPFGTKNFNTLNLKKLELLRKFSSDPAIRYGVYMDGDIAAYADFLPDILQRLQAPAAPPIYLQCDESTRVDCAGNPGCVNGCTGFLAWSHGLDTRIFDTRGDALKVWKERPEDQVFVNRMMKELGMPVMTLPRLLYPNGSFVSMFGPGSLRKRSAFILHYNYIVGVAKRLKIKNNGDWTLPY